MSQSSFTIEGVIPAPLSAFDEARRFDYDTFSRQIEYFAKEGANGVFLTGTTAEGAYLTAEERIRAIETVDRVAGDALTIYAVIVRPGTRQVIEEMASIKGTAVRCLAAVTPFYMGVDGAEIETHYREIADKSPLPTMLYNIPQNTHNKIPVESILRLAEHDNIIGIKDSSGDFISFVHGLLKGPDGFAWVQGEDRLDAPSFLIGAPAIVTGLGNVDIRPYVTMYRAARDGDKELVLQSQRRINELASIIDVAHGKVIQAIKSATAVAGRATHQMRQRAMDLSPETIDALRSRVAELDIT